MDMIRNKTNKLNGKKANKTNFISNKNTKLKVPQFSLVKPLQKRSLSIKPFSTKVSLNSNQNKKRMPLPFNNNSSLRVSKKPYNMNSKGKTLKQLQRPLKIQPINSVKYNVSKTRKMSWAELKQRFPMMNPNADADFDGLVNARDCKPLDPSKDGKFSSFIGKILGKKPKEGEDSELYEKAEKKKKATEDYYSSLSAEELVEQADTRDETPGGKKKEKTATQILKETEQDDKRMAKEYEQKQKAIQKFKDDVEKAKQEREAVPTKLQEIKKSIKEQAKELFQEAKEYDPEKMLAARVLKKALPHTTYKTIIVKGKKKRIAVTTGGILPSGKQRGAIVRATKQFAGVDTSSSARSGKTAKGQKLEGAGRPKGSYKYKDPRTGEPITAVEYHKLRKQLKSQAKAIETRAEIQQRVVLAKRGLSPEEVAIQQEEMNAKMARLRALKEMKQEETTMVREQPTELYDETLQAQQPEEQAQPQPQRRQHIESMIEAPGTRDIPPGYRLQEDLMTGKKKLVPLPPQEAWSR